MNLLFTIDRGYAGHLAECIESIIRFPSQDGYDIYILHSDLREQEITELSKLMVKDKIMLHFQYVDPQMFSSFPESERYPRLIYYRIFAARLLPQNLDRILYLDADTIAINSLEKLYHMDFGENYFLACTHIRKVLNKMNRVRLGIEEDVMYINSGVMLMNLEALRKHIDSQEISDYVSKRKKYLLLPDQDIITALYGNRTGILDSLIYNLSDRVLAFYNSSPKNEKRDLEWIRENTVIIHYYGKNKPWNKHYQGKLDIFYLELLKERQNMQSTE